MNIWVSTRNAHKAEEISMILAPHRVRTLLDLPDFPEIDENGASYRENAELKARALFEKVREPVFADDSGLEVDALGGRPGIHSARFSGLDTNHQRNIDKLLAALHDVPESGRTARFRCVIVYIDATGLAHEFVGVLEGSIGSMMRGKGGFGYDPVFMLPEKGCSVAELPAAEKNSLSHRARALAQLSSFLKIPGK
ncbi:MAG TPA: RdgB/HAM1 family non-canonical purine NTP pyrophosphatase [Candidatus Rifleibacterium sp.]|nr:RdgB/HAM1 family non-canonical purine NTP pyrophosphatase [Candidatus Rifleibacterium sp.]HPT44841.1 RdgB/HAM1 family non-canonical purine NTP pyrophosphatase [Candidatus Rifleibacterium sp.]